SGTEAVVSILKSLIVGGGTLAGSGRGIAASIASSAALLRDGSAWAIAEVAETVRNVAATAIRTRSNPPRLFKQSRIVTPLWANRSRSRNSSGYRRAASAKSAGLANMQRPRNDLTQTIHMPRFCSQRHTRPLTTN